MTLEHFKAVKANTESYMTYMLGLSKQLGYPLKDFCREAVITTVTIEDKAEEDLQAKIRMLATMPNLTVKGHTRPQGRYDIFKSVVFTSTVYKVREAIHPDQVQAEMKKFVRRQLGLYEWSTLHCEIMDLFKKGIIDWDKVIQAHKGECSL